MSSVFPRRVRWRAPVIQATGRLRLADRLSSGALSCSGLCRSGVRTKFGIDMVLLGEPGTTRSSKEGCTGPVLLRPQVVEDCYDILKKYCFSRQGPQLSKRIQAFLTDFTC